MQELNNGKVQVAHETGNVAKKFWYDATLIYNVITETTEVLDAGEVHIQQNLWEDVKNMTIDVPSSEKIKQTTSDLVDTLDVAVKLPATNKKRAVGEILLAKASKGAEGVVR